jgi:RNA polymerase sigma factor
MRERDMGYNELNEEAILAGEDPDQKEAFINRHEVHIQRLAGKITHRIITKSDEEWSVVLLAVASALDTYDMEKGNFWSYAAVVAKNRLTDYYRSETRRSSEIPARPETFEGNVDEDDPDFSLQLEIQKHAAVTVDNSLRDEIAALSDELSEFDISFFDLAECSPKAAKTRSACAKLITAFFTPPPPLVNKLRRSGMLPVKELTDRSRVSRKIVDRYRKYLIASALILDGDYPGIADYLSEVKKDVMTEGGRK